MDLKEYAVNFKNSNYHINLGRTELTIYKASIRLKISMKTTHRNHLWILR